jgi:hypothetical protein
VSIQIEKPKSVMKNQFTRTTIGVPEQWLIEAGVGIGLNLAGFVHEVTDHFRSHVIKRHGDLAAHGAATVTDADLARIPDIVKTPDTVIIGAVRRNAVYIIYAKTDAEVTCLYFEQILDSRKNKALRGATFYKVLKPLALDKILGIVTMNGKTDLSKAKIFSPVKFKMS